MSQLANPDFATSVTASFNKQNAMHLIRATLPGGAGIVPPMFMSDAVDPATPAGQQPLHRTPGAAASSRVTSSSVVWVKSS